MTVVLVRNALYAHDRVPPAGRPYVTVGRPGRLVRIVSAVLPVPAASLGAWPVTDEHLRAGPDETDPAWLRAADIVVRTAFATGTAPAPGAGCLLVAVVEGGRERVVVRDRGCVVETAVAGSAGTFASIVHTWLVIGRSVDELAGASLTVGGGSARPITVGRAAGAAAVAS